MKLMKKKLIAVLMSAAMLVPVLSGCGCSTATDEEGGVTTGETTKVVLNEVAHSLFYAPMYVAIEEGYFADEGIDLELVTGFGADKTMTAVLSGEVACCEIVHKKSPFKFLTGSRAPVDYKTEAVLVKTRKN